MKKFSLVLLMLILPFCLVGCGKSNLEIVNSNMSEITNIFFLGQNEESRASISVGRRENPYFRDGIHREECEFSLISLSAGDGLLNMRLSAVIVVNNHESNIVLELVGNSYMFDLEYCLKKDDNIKLEFEGQSISFIRQDFEIDSEKAVELGTKHLDSVFKNYINKNSLSGECYLKVLGEVGTDFNELFWAFTLLGRDGKTFNVVISVNNGNIISEN